MGKRADKANGAKLPKRVAGVKLPKELRKQGDALIAKAQTPEGRAAIAKGAALVAGAAASMAQAVAAKKQPAADTSGQRGPDAQNPVADAIGAGVDAVLGRLFGKP